MSAARVVGTLTRIRPVLGAVAEGVLLPVGVYVGLTALGVGEALALGVSAGSSAVVLAASWLRTRRLNTLGILVLVRFLLSLALLGLTGDARLMLAKDAAITALMGIAVLVSAALHRSLIVRIQRDLSPDHAAFDRHWRDEPRVRRRYGRLTAVWGVALLAEPVVEIMIIYTTTLTTAVVLCNLAGTGLILGLIALTRVATRAAAA